MKEKKRLKRLMEAASKTAKADLVIKNINIIDVFTQSVYTEDVAIKDGYIVGIGEYEGEEEIDGRGKYISPSFIDAHMHLESSLVTPRIYEKCVLPHGVTTVIADPHEIANAAGKKGIEYILEAVSKCTMDFHVMLPSCVPATSLDMGGAVLKSEDIKKFYDNENVLGLGEVMDAGSVLGCEEDMLSKIATARKKGRVLDGHCAGADLATLNTYITAGITTDHECQSGEEVLARLRRGMYVLMREGTAAKNLRELSEVITPQNGRRVCLCTDDKHLDEIIVDGTIDNAVRIAIEEGIEPVLAYQLATLNAAECYGLKESGAIAPGYKADFLILADMERVEIESVYKDGKAVVEDRKVLVESEEVEEMSDKLLHSVNIPSLDSAQIEIVLENNKVNVIEFMPNRLETNHIVEEVALEDGIFKGDTEKDLLPLLVIDRYSGEVNIGKGIIKGFTLKNGAIATTIAHDSHNIIAVGTNTEDILLAVEELKNIHGGIVYAREGKVEGSVQLEIAGLITGRDHKELLEDMERVHDAVEIENKDFNPFLALSFLALSVIPDIKLTSKGLYSFVERSLIPLESK